MTLEEYAIGLKRSLEKREKTITRVAREINEQTYDDGTSLSIADKEKILDIIEHGELANDKDYLCHSDNSTWLKTVALLRSSVDGVRKK